MKTLLLTEVFPPQVGGSGRWFWEIYRRMPRKGYVIAAGKVPGYEEFDRSHDLRVERLPLRLPGWGLFSPGELHGYVRAYRAVNRLLRRESVGQIHCGRCLPEGWLGLMLKWGAGIRYVCYAHGEEVNIASSGDGHGVLSSRQHCWMTKLVLHQATLVIANSRNTAALLRNQWGMPDERVRVLYPGVDTGRFRPAERDPEERERLGWGDRPVVLTVGRLQKRKGHDVMIAALAAVRRVVPDVLFAVVGDGEERPTLEAMVRRAGLGDHVQFRGEVTDEDLVRSYQQCDLFALSNRQVGQDIEGFGMVLLEAQSCGKPVVAGASGGTAETMRVGESGLVVNCDGPGELAALVVELLSNHERLAEMGLAARRWVLERFDWGALSREAQELFTSVVAENASGRAANKGIGPFPAAGSAVVD